MSAGDGEGVVAGTEADLQIGEVCVGNPAAHAQTGEYGSGERSRIGKSIPCVVYKELVDAGATIERKQAQDAVHRAARARGQTADAHNIVAVPGLHIGRTSDRMKQDRVGPCAGIEVRRSGMRAGNRESVATVAQANVDHRQARVSDRGTEAEAGQRGGGQGAGVRRTVAGIVHKESRTASAAVDVERSVDAVDVAAARPQAGGHAGNPDGVVTAVEFERRGDVDALNISRVGTGTEADQQGFETGISDSGPHIQAGDRRGRDGADVVVRIATIVEAEAVGIIAAVDGDCALQAIQIATRHHRSIRAELEDVVAVVAVDGEQACVGPNVESVVAVVAIHRDRRRGRRAVNRERIIS